MAARSAATTTSRSSGLRAHGVGGNEFWVTHDDPSFFVAVRNRNMVRTSRVKRLDVQMTWIVESEAETRKNREPSEPS